MRAILAVLLYAAAFYIWGRLVSPHWGNIAAYVGVIVAGLHIGVIIRLDKEAFDYFWDKDSVETLTNNKVLLLWLMGGSILSCGLLAHLIALY